MGLQYVELMRMCFRENDIGKRTLLLVLLLVMSILFLPVCLADDMTFSLDQKEFYFRIGEQPVITLHADNGYDNPVSGNLKYTLTQEVRQSGFQFSSSNSQSSPLTVEEGQSDIPIGFSPSKDPGDLKVSTKFDYTDDDGDAMEVSLDDITIHFVSDDSQKENNQEKVSGSSQPASQDQASQTDPFAQQEKRMQQMMNQMMQQNPSQNQNTQNSAQQRLQNNQMSQDSSALKKQMQEQVQQQQEMKKNLQKNLAEDPEFQRQHKDLLDQGYNITGGNINPVSNDTGDIDLEYQNSEGQKAELSAKLQDGKVKDLKVDSPETRKQMMDKLNQDPRFQQFNQQLQQEGFHLNDTSFSQGKNSTDISLTYQDGNNQTAVIDAHIVNETVDEVNLTRDSKHMPWWLLPLAVAIVGLILWLIFRKKDVPEKDVVVARPEKPFDYTSEAKRLLKESERLFDEKRYKDAYGSAGQAMRLYLSHKNHLKKEVTNDEIVHHLRRHKKPYRQVKECFDLCSLVEFAKYRANRRDFNKILKIAGSLIR